MSLYTKVNTDSNFVEREHEVEKFWEEKIFEKSMKIGMALLSIRFMTVRRPPNGKPHIGHVLTRGYQGYDSPIPHHEGI